MSAPRGRPNLNQVHARPLPLDIHPLPAFYPHNPLSLFHLLYVFVNQTLSSASSHPSKCYQAMLSEQSGTIQVVDPETTRALWEQGFFGKGSLSRSEPNWLDKVKRQHGLLGQLTSEEITQKRRKERKAFKAERARKERELIESQLSSERHVNGAESLASKPTNGAPSAHQTDEEPVHEAGSISPSATPKSVMPQLRVEEDQKTPSLGQGSKALPQVRFSTLPDPAAGNRAESEGPSQSEIEMQEHLQLTPEECFFLVFGLGVLVVINQATGRPYSPSFLFTRFRQMSYFPPVDPAALSSEDPFLSSYVVYHHFRSLGWVVRPGIKFAVDWLLYKRGPAFSHAEFAVLTLPSRRNSTAPERDAKGDGKKPWWWLHCANRVQSQVRKSLILVFVDMPDMSDMQIRTDEDITQILERFKIRELVLRRWIPNRNRD